MGDAVAHTVLTTVLEEECLVPDSPEKGRHEPTIVTVPAADFPTGSYVRSGTTYGEESENFFEEQYFEGDTLPAESADTSLPASSPGIETFESRIHDNEDTKLKITICQVANATVYDDSETQPCTS